MRPTHVTQVKKMTADELDQAAFEICGKPFHPAMTLSERRRALWGMVVRSNVVPKKRFVVDLPAKAEPHGIPRADMDAHAVLAAARCRIGLTPLMNVLDAHYRGVGEYPSDIGKQLSKLLKRINQQYGWGVRQYEDGTVEVFA